MSRTTTTQPQGPATTSAATPTSDAAIGAAYLQFRRLEREHAAITALDASRGDVGGRGELTKQRDQALATVRASADAVIDAERE
jgi:hypothetical protein